MQSLDGSPEPSFSDSADGNGPLPTSTEFLRLRSYEFSYPKRVFSLLILLYGNGRLLPEIPGAGQILGVGQDIYFLVAEELFRVVEDSVGDRLLKRLHDQGLTEPSDQEETVNNVLLAYVTAGGSVLTLKVHSIPDPLYAALVKNQSPLLAQVFAAAMAPAMPYVEAKVLALWERGHCAEPELSFAYADLESLTTKAFDRSLYEVQGDVSLHSMAEAFWRQKGLHFESLRKVIGVRSLEAGKASEQREGKAA